MILFLRFFLLVGTLGLMGCAATFDQPLMEPPALGLSAAEVKQRYGKPEKEENHPDGTTSLYYWFGSEITTHEPFSSLEADGGIISSSVGYSESTERILSVAPLKFDRAGRLTPPLPQGKLVRR